MKKQNLNEQIWQFINERKEVNGLTFYDVVGRFYHFALICHEISNLVFSTSGYDKSNIETYYDGKLVRVFEDGKETGRICRDSDGIDIELNKVNGNRLKTLYEMYLTQRLEEYEEMKEAMMPVVIESSWAHLVIQIDEVAYLRKTFEVNGVRRVVNFVPSKDSKNILIVNKGEFYYLVSEEVFKELLKSMSVKEKDLPVYLSSIYQDINNEYRVKYPLLEERELANRLDSNDLIWDYYDVVDASRKNEVRGLPTYALIEAVIGDTRSVVIKPEEFFEIVDGVKVIREFYRSNEVLRKVNPTLLNFAGADIRGIDFSGTHFMIDFQKVYKRDLTGCDFTNVALPFADFSECIVDDCVFINSFANLENVATGKNLIADKTNKIGTNCELVPNNEQVILIKKFPEEVC